MPSVAASIWKQLGLGAAQRLTDIERWPGGEPGRALGAREVLFPLPKPGKAA